MNMNDNVYDPRSTEKSAKTERPGREPEEENQPFPMDCLPPIMRAIVEDVSRVERTPEPLGACCALGVVSASLGKGLQLQSGPSRITRPNLFILASAVSGCGKSETYRHIAKPFNDFEAELVEHHKHEALPRARSEKGMLEAEIASLKKKGEKGVTATEREKIRAEMQRLEKALADEENNLTPPRLRCDNVTTEKLAVMLEQNKEQLFSNSSDARPIVDNILGRYAAKTATDEAIYIKAWSGDPCRTDRQGRGPVNLAKPCLSALWFLQPDKVAALFAKSELTDGGLLPRFLMCHTNARLKPIQPGSAGIQPIKLDAWNLLISQLIKKYRLAPEPATI